MKEILSAMTVAAMLSSLVSSGDGAVGYGFMALAFGVLRVLTESD